LALSPSPRICSADVRVLLPSAAEPTNSPGDALARRRLVDVLTSANWNIDRTALTLGVHRVTVYRHMKRLGVTPRSRAKLRNWIAEGMLRE
jgi:transcriptional regulator of acetoin/glycerol metabolism